MREIDATVGIAGVGGVDTAGRFDAVSAAAAGGLRRHQAYGGDFRSVGAERDQSSGREVIEHLDQRIADVGRAAELAHTATPARIRPAFAEVDQIDQHPARQYPRGRAERSDARVGVVGKHDVESAAVAIGDALVARQRQIAPLALHPELLEGDLEQRQRLGGAIELRFPDQALDEVGLDVGARDLGGARDRLPQRCAAQRGELDAVVLEVVPYRTSHQIAVEVRPHAEQDRHAGHATQGGEPREEPRAFTGFVGFVEIDLFELIDVHEATRARRCRDQSGACCRLVVGAKIRLDRRAEPRIERVERRAQGEVRIRARVGDRARHRIAALAEHGQDARAHQRRLAAARRTHQEHAPTIAQLLDDRSTFVVATEEQVGVIEAARRIAGAEPAQSRIRTLRRRRLGGGEREPRRQRRQRGGCALGGAAIEAHQAALPQCQELARPLRAWHEVARDQEQPRLALLDAEADGEQARELSPLVDPPGAAGDQQRIATRPHSALEFLELEGAHVIFGARPVLALGKAERRDDHTAHPRLVLARVGDVQQVLWFSWHHTPPPLPRSLVRCPAEIFPARCPRARPYGISDP